MLSSSPASSTLNDFFMQVNRSIIQAEKASSDDLDRLSGMVAKVLHLLDLEPTEALPFQVITNYRCIHVLIRLVFIYGKRERCVFKHHMLLSSGLVSPWHESKTTWRCPRRSTALLSYCFAYFI